MDDHRLATRPDWTRGRGACPDHGSAHSVRQGVLVRHHNQRALHLIDQVRREEPLCVDPQQWCGAYCHVRRQRVPASLDVADRRLRDAGSGCQNKLCQTCIYARFSQSCRRQRLNPPLRRLEPPKSQLTARSTAETYAHHREFGVRSRVTHVTGHARGSPRPGSRPAYPMQCRARALVANPWTGRVSCPTGVA